MPEVVSVPVIVWMPEVVAGCAGAVLVLFPPWWHGETAECICKKKENFNYNAYRGYLLSEASFLRTGWNKKLGEGKVRGWTFEWQGNNQ